MCLLCLLLLGLFVFCVDVVVSLFFFDFVGFNACVSVCVLSVFSCCNNACFACVVLLCCRCCFVVCLNCLLFKMYVCACFVIECCLFVFVV